MRVNFFGEGAILIDVGDGDFSAGDDGDPDCGNEDCCGSASQRDASQDLAGWHPQQSIFFQFGFDRVQSGGDNQGDPGDGGHRVDPNGAAPAAEPGFAGEVGIGCQRVPTLDAEAGVPSAGPHVERHEEHGDCEDLGRSPADDIGLCQSDSEQYSQRQGDGFDSCDEPGGVEEQPPDAVVDLAKCRGHGAREKEQQKPGFRWEPAFWHSC